MKQLRFPHAIEELRQLLAQTRPFLDPIEAELPHNVQIVDAFLQHFSAWHIRALAEYIGKGGVVEEWSVAKVPDVEAVGGVMVQPLLSLAVPEDFWREEVEATPDLL